MLKWDASSINEQLESVKLVEVYRSTGSVCPCFDKLGGCVCVCVCVWCVYYVCSCVRLYVCLHAWVRACACVCVWEIVCVGGACINDAHQLQRFASEKLIRWSKLGLFLTIGRLSISSASINKSTGRRWFQTKSVPFLPTFGFPHSGELTWSLSWTRGAMVCVWRNVFLRRQEALWKRHNRFRANTVACPNGSFGVRVKGEKRLWITVSGMNRNSGNKTVVERTLLDRCLRLRRARWWRMDVLSDNGGCKRKCIMCVFLCVCKR